MSEILSDRRTKRLFCLLALVCVVVRIGLLGAYAPVSGGDAPGYVAVAENLRTLDFSHYDGQRTPGYPLLILVAGFDHHAVSVIQSLLGVLTSLMLFALALMHTRNRALAFTIGAAHSLVFNTLFLELLMMTEVLAIFLLVLSLLIYTAIATGEANRGRVRWYAVLSFVVSWAALTRPLLSLLAPIYFIFLLARFKGTAASIARRTACLVAYAAPVSLAILGWCALNVATVGYFGLTTLTGINLAQHSLPYTHLAGDKYAAVRGVVQEQRRVNLQNTGSCQVGLWEVRPRIQEATGLSSVELSRELTGMTIDIFSRRPQLYVQSVWEAWLRFWIGPDVIGQDRIERSAVTTVVLAAWRLERPLIVFMNVLFLNIALYLFHQFVVSRRTEYVSGFPFLVATIVVSASVVQALMENGANMRYELPYQPLMMSVAGVAAWRFLSRAID